MGSGWEGPGIQNPKGVSLGLEGHRVLPLNEAETQGSGVRPPGGHISTGGFWLLLEPQLCGRELRASVGLL